MDTSDISRYIELTLQRQSLNAQIGQLVSALRWSADPLLGPGVQTATPAHAGSPIRQVDLLGFVRVMLGLMAVEHQRVIMGPDRVTNGGGPETPEPHEPHEPHDPVDRGGPPPALVDADRRACDAVRSGIEGSPLSPADKQKAIDALEAHHRACAAGTGPCHL